MFVQKINDMEIIMGINFKSTHKEVEELSHKKYWLAYSAASISTLMACNILMAFSLFVMESLNSSTCCRLVSSCCRFLSRLPRNSIRCSFMVSISSRTFSGDCTIFWLSFCPLSSAWVMASLILSYRTQMEYFTLTITKITAFHNPSWYTVIGTVLIYMGETTLIYISLPC